AARPGLSGSNVSRVSAADLDLVSFVLDSAFNYVTGPYEGFTHETNNQKGIIKFDWNVGKNHTLTAIYNFLDASKQKPAHPAAIGRRGPDATTLQFYNSGYQINNKINSVLVELKSTFGNSYANKFQIGYTHFDDSRDPFSATFPVVSIQKDGIRYIVAGHEPFSIHNLLDQKVFQFSDNFDMYVKDHTITAGVSFEKFEFDNSFNLNAYGGTFGDWPTVQAFINEVRTGAFNDDVAAAEARKVQDLWATPETNVGQFAIYAQDKWQVNDKLTVTLGIRMDKPLYFDTSEKVEESIDQQQEINGGFNAYDPSVIYYDENDKQVQFDHTELPDGKPLFSPRLGINWDVTGDTKTIIRGGSGLFTGRFPFVWVGNQVANPNFYFYCMTANDFKFPQVWRSNIGIDKAFGEGWMATVDIMYTKDINAMMVRNYGINSPGGTLQGVDNRQIYTAGDRVTPYANNAYIFTNTDIGRTFNMTFELKRNWSNGIYTSLAYNYLDAQDASSIEAEISSDAYDRNPAFGHVNKAVLAPSAYGNKHRVVGNANKTFEYGQGKFATTLSIFFEYAKGGRFSYTYSGDINGDGSALNDLIYVPTDSEIDAMTFRAPVFAGEPTAAQQRTALKSFIAQDEYLSGRRGEYAEKYAQLSPWFSRWDIRILQDFKLGNKNTIQLSFDILNAGNL
ncbi:MAG TPA: TonB-dependent receptor, partial [Cyclobacteriaceae bacterium]|nr:TonB-dependent receptor [Cyclobacteriaceae bacterium]